jgi:outer membrane receptor protein involved in Fe transport
VDSIQVVGSTIELPASLQGSSVDVIPSGRVRSSNEPFAMDLLRYIPGVAFNQTGSPGGVSSLFLRGGNSNLNLVQIDGVPVNSFGGSFDFAHIPVEAVDHVDFIRGAQSAVYGSYANAGAIDFVTRRPESAPQFSLLAEGGSHSERRFGITGTGTVAGFGLLISASRYDSDGVVANDDYHNEDVLFNVTRRFGRQNVSMHGYFDSSEVGEPGPFGSNPQHIYTGIDMVSRAKNNFSEYGAHYEAAASQANTDSASIGICAAPERHARSSACRRTTRLPSVFRADTSPCKTASLPTPASRPFRSSATKSRYTRRIATRWEAASS